MEPTVSTPQPPPPPPPVAPAKKKTSPLVWVLVGCLGLFVICGIIIGTVGFFAAKKAKNFIEDVAENPVRASVEAMVRLNPELELVSTDDEAETMTIRNTETGEVATFDWSDIQNGNFTFGADGKEYTVDASAAADGSFTVENESGEEVAAFGPGAAEVPSWFPQYPDSVAVSVLLNVTQDGQESRIWTFQSGAPVADVLAFYEERLQGDGWDVTSSTSSVGDITSGTIDGKRDSGASTLNLVVSKSGGDAAQVMVTYTGTPSG